MATYDKSKAGAGAVFPDRASDGQEWTRVEPLIVPSQLKDRFLFGIPLFSSYRNPNTGQFDEMSDMMLKDFIERGVAQAELETGLSLFPTQYDEKHPFDMNWWRSYGYLKMQHGPIASVEELSFSPSSGGSLFTISPDWIESANFSKGQINIVPLVPTGAGQFVGNSTGSTNGSAFLSFLGGMSWIPALIKVKYTTGFPNGIMPRVVNELIGIYAAMEILGILAATNKASSYSLGIDGINQSVSTPGPQVYQARMEYLQSKKDMLVKKLKNVYGMQLTSSYV